jgi:hypothetical protein
MYTIIPQSLYNPIPVKCRNKTKSVAKPQVCEYAFDKNLWNDGRIFFIRWLSPESNYDNTTRFEWRLENVCTLLNLNVHACRKITVFNLVVLKVLCDFNAKAKQVWIPNMGIYTTILPCCCELEGCLIDPSNSDRVPYIKYKCVAHGGSPIIAAGRAARRWKGPKSSNDILESDIRRVVNNKQRVCTL